MCVCVSHGEEGKQKNLVGWVTVMCLEFPLALSCFKTRTSHTGLETDSIFAVSKENLKI